MEKDKPKAEIIFNRTSEFLYYIVNNLDSEYNLIRFTLSSKETNALLANGEVRYMEDINGLESGMFYINIYNANREIASKLTMPLKINTSIEDTEIDLAKNGCYNTKSILKMFTKLELGAGIKYKVDIFNDKKYYETLKRNIMHTTYDTLLIELHKLYIEGYNSFKVVIGFENFYYSMIGEFNFVHMFHGIIFTTRVYLEDSKENIVVVSTFCKEENSYGCIIEMVNSIKDALENIKHHEKYIFNNDNIGIEYWREKYE